MDRGFQRLIGCGGIPQRELEGSQEGREFTEPGRYPGRRVFMNVRINTDSHDYTIVIIDQGSRGCSEIRFEGCDHMENAMRFVSRIVGVE